MINKRTEFALRCLQPGVNFSELCCEYGISRKTGYNWRDRFEADGAAGMLDVSRRPQSSPSQLSEDQLCRIAQIRERHPKWGPKKALAIYQRSHGDAPSLSSFKRVYEKCGWTRKRVRRRASQAGTVRTGRVASEPNEVWTVDFKGWWRVAEGARCEPLTVRDEFSRMVLEVRSLADARTDSVRAAFERLFSLHGLPEAIRSDNGSPFAATSAPLALSRLSAWWVALGIDLERGRPGKPQDNSAHERMHLDIFHELESCASGSLGEQQAAFDIWRETFNCQRPHESLEMKTPAEVYRSSSRTYQGTPADLSYAGMMARRVNKTGCIAMQGRRILISTALAGWSVGLRPIAADSYEVHFARLRLGEIELSTASFLRAASGAEEGCQTNRKTS